MDQTRNYSIFGRQVGYVVAADIITLAVTLVEIPIITKGLGADLYGTWALINATVLLLTPFALLALNIGIVRFLAGTRDPDTVRDDFLSISTLVVATGGALSLLLFALSSTLATAVFDDPSAAPTLRLASALVLLSALYQLPLAYFRMKQKIGLQTVLTLLTNLARMALIILFVQMWFTVSGVVAAVLIATFAFNLLGFALALRDTGLAVPRFRRIKTYVKWGAPLAPNAAIAWILHTSDRYMISYFLGVAFTGVYSAAYAIGCYASFALVPLALVLYPNLMKHHNQAETEQARDYLKYSFRYLMMITIPAAAGLSMLAAPLLSVLTTPEFAGGAKIVPYVAFGWAFYSLFQITGFVMHAANKTHLTVLVLVAAALLNIALNLVLIPRWGIDGAAAATLIADGALGLMMLVLSRRYLKFDLSLPFLAKAGIASGIMAAVIWVIDPGTLVMVLATIVAGVIVYFAALILMRGLSRYELSFFWSFIRGSGPKLPKTLAGG